MGGRIWRGLWRGWIEWVEGQQRPRVRDGGFQPLIVWHDREWFWVFGVVEKMVEGGCGGRK